MGCWTVMLSYLTVSFLNGSALTRCLRFENSREWRSPVKAISRDTGVKLADSLPLRSDVAPNGVDPQVLELLIGNRWQRRLMSGCSTKGLLWCSPAQVRSFPLLTELDTRATHFNAVSKTATTGQDKLMELFLFSIPEQEWAVLVSRCYGFSDNLWEYLKIQSAKLTYRSFFCFSQRSGCV